MTDQPEQAALLSPVPQEGRLDRVVGTVPARHAPFDIAVGVVTALVAVAVRYALPLSSFQLPTLTVVVAVALLTTFVGPRSGIAAAIVGGLLSWYIFFNPFSWEMTAEGLIPLFGFAVITGTIITTSALYRSAARREYQVRLAVAEEHARASDLFAGEMAHRLKNALAVIQSVAFQTLGYQNPSSIAFAERLRSIAAAQDLLSEHLNEPTADVFELPAKVLAPFDPSGARIGIDCPGELRVSSREAVSLALAAHELATNATKYGALSVPGGKVRLSAERNGEDLEFCWIEQGGPTVTVPDKPGFGTKLLKQIGDGVFDLQPSGLRCTWRLRG